MSGPAASSASPNVLVRANVVGTALFVVSATVAAVVFTEPVRVVGVVVALALFAVGVFSFLSSYWTAVQRSRSSNIAVSQLYFLSGPATPAAVRRTMNGALAVQVIVAFATAIGRSSTGGHRGSSLAFGVLVPMFGLGLNGLWCARNGAFEPRADGTAHAPNAANVNGNSRDVPPSPQESEENANHG